MRGLSALWTDVRNTLHSDRSVFRGPCIAVPHYSAMNGCVFRTLEKQDLVHPAPAEPPPPFSLCIKDALLTLPVALRSPLKAHRAVSTLPSQVGYVQAYLNFRKSLKNRSVLIAPCRFTLPLRCGVQTVVASTSERQGWWWNNDITAMHKLASRQQSYFWHEKEYLNVTRIDHKKFHRGREK